MTNNYYNIVSWPRTFYRSAVICFVMIFSLGLFHRGAAVLIPYSLAWLTIIVLRKKEYAAALSLSTVLGIIWVYIGRNLYLYKNEALVVGGINMFTLASFALGLLGVYIIYRQFLAKLRYRKYYRQIILYIGIYWTLLISFEWAGYHIFDIKNEAAAAYPGLLFFNCLHAPPFMQIAYLSFGPVFFLLFTFLYPRFRVPFGRKIGRFLSPFFPAND